MIRRIGPTQQPWTWRITTVWIKHGRMRIEPSPLRQQRPADTNPITLHHEATSAAWFYSKLTLQLKLVSVMSILYFNFQTSACIFCIMCICNWLINDSCTANVIKCLPLFIIFLVKSLKIYTVNVFTSVCIIFHDWGMNVFFRCVTRVIM